MMSNKSTISSRSKIAQFNTAAPSAASRATATTTTTTATTKMRVPDTHMTPSASRLMNSQLLSIRSSAVTTNPKMNPPPSRISSLATTAHTTIARPKLSSTTSSASSSTTAIHRMPLITSSSTTVKKPLVRSSINNHNNNAPPSKLTAPSSTTTISSQRPIPDTVQIRKGLAKFSNPMECQRQFQALSLKIQELEKNLKDRDNSVDRLENQLKQSINQGVCYATVVQYLAKKLKLDSQNDLTKECEQLKTKVDLLTAQEAEFESKMKIIINDYKNHLQVELDLRERLNEELLETKKAHNEFLNELNETHKNELNDLNKEHSEIKEKLESRIENLESELKTTTKDLVELRKEYDILINDFNKLEESLTKDKDARVRYLQEKIDQLQKDVDSLNSVLEIRTEKMHSLEKDSLLLIEVQNSLKTHQDTIKTLNQQLESLNAALEKKRGLYDNLIAEHEKLRQDLKAERSERRRMTMKSEQLEYVLNESCGSESDIVFNGTNKNGVKDVDNNHRLISE